jgi:pimeloyl-ACP methyl ester carboxylesterase
VDYLSFDEFDGQYWRPFNAKLWEKNKDAYQKHLARCWGRMPDLDQIDSFYIEVEQKDGYKIEKYELKLSEMQYIVDDLTPVWLLIPDSPRSTPCPAMIVHHQHAGQFHLGKEEPAGIDGDPEQFLAIDLVRQGYVVVVFDALAFSSRQEPGGERFTFTRLLMWGMTLNGKYCWDISKVVDFLYTMKIVDKNRIGIIGHSLGGQMAIWGAVFDPRIKVIISSCGFGRIAGNESILQHQINHNFAAYLPNFLDASLKMDMHEVIGLLHPRPLILANGGTDRIFPIEGVAEIHKFVEDLYAHYGNSDKILTLRHDGGHGIPKESKQQFWDFLVKWL